MLENLKSDADANAVDCCAKVRINGFSMFAWMCSGWIILHFFSRQFLFTFHRKMGAIAAMSISGSFQLAYLVVFSIFLFGWFVRSTWCDRCCFSSTIFSVLNCLHIAAKIIICKLWCVCACVKARINVLFGVLFAAPCHGTKCLMNRWEIMPR